MKTWKFNSDKDVQTFWLGVREVPRRAEGRTTKQYERFYLGLYLLALADHGLLSYPIKGEEGERPDFMLTWKSGETTGLEISRATDEELQRWMTQAQKKRPEGSAMRASPGGYAGDQIEEEWCALVRCVIKKKVAMFSNYRPALRYDLLIPDDTRTGAGDRRKVLAILAPWASELNHSTPKLGRISCVTSLDVLYDIGGESSIFPYIRWSAPAAQGEGFSDRVEHAGRIATLQAIRAHKEAGAPTYSMDRKGRLVKETSDGRRFEVRVREDGEEVTIRELSLG